SPWLMWSRRAVVCEVPICPSCRMQADRYRLLARLSFVATVIAVFLLAPYFIPDDAGRQRRRLITLGVILVATVPLIVVMVAFPPIVDLTVDRKGVAYEFRRRDYAELFCATNDGARIDD
ncbi:MAG: hypothetical protein KDC98_17940, partial [Planctomycetes bacterium]|nr:hypothetical protein [Planctomycetota bacterium]